jgi:hypothetical protein
LQARRAPAAAGEADFPKFLLSAKSGELEFPTHRSFEHLLSLWRGEPGALSGEEGGAREGPQVAAIAAFR